jgi:hypothetical protein
MGKTKIPAAARSLVLAAGEFYAYVGYTASARRNLSRWSRP